MFEDQPIIAFVWNYKLLYHVWRGVYKLKWGENSVEEKARRSVENGKHSK